MEVVFVLILIALIANQIAIVIWTRRKCRALNNAVLATERDAQQAFQQAEHLISLYRELSNSPVLSPTRGWAGSPDFLRVVRTAALEFDAPTIVECSSGVSTLVIAATLAKAGRGHVYSLEHEEKFAAKTRESLQTWGLSQFATVIHAPLKPYSDQNFNGVWYSTDAIESVAAIDLLVVDGPPTGLGPIARYPAGPVLIPRLATNGVILMDDADRTDEQQTIAIWQRLFPKLTTSSTNAEKGCVAMRY